MDFEFRSEDLPEWWLNQRRPQDLVDVRELKLVTYQELMLETWDHPWGYIDLIFLAGGYARN